jgi:hypothetical protein
MGGACNMYGEQKYVNKPEGKRLVGRPRSRLDGSIKI